jgi:hypothetical protein
MIPASATRALCPESGIGHLILQSRPRLEIARDRRGHQQRAFRLPQEAEACLVGVILTLPAASRTPVLHSSTSAGKFRSEDLFREPGQVRAGLKGGGEGQVPPRPSSPGGVPADQFGSWSQPDLQEQVHPVRRRQARNGIATFIAALGRRWIPAAAPAWLLQLHARIVMRIWPVNCEDRTNSGTRRVYLGARVPAGQRRSRSVRCPVVCCLQTVTYQYISPPGSESCRHVECQPYVCRAQ